MLIYAERFVYLYRVYIRTHCGVSPIEMQSLSTGKVKPETWVCNAWLLRDNLKFLPRNNLSFSYRYYLFRSLFSTIGKRERGSEHEFPTPDPRQAIIQTIHLPVYLRRMRKTGLKVGLPITPSPAVWGWGSGSPEPECMVPPAGWIGTNPHPVVI